METVLNLWQKWRHGKLHKITSEKADPTSVHRTHMGSGKGKELEFGSPISSIWIVRKGEIMRLV
jgi:hypothetical protein